MRKAVFFDRDGVLNVDKSYLGFIKDFEWMDGAKEALAYLTEEAMPSSSSPTRAASPEAIIRKTT